MYMRVNDAVLQMYIYVRVHVHGDMCCRDTANVSFSLRMERFQGGHSVLGWNDPREVIQS